MKKYILFIFFLLFLNALNAQSIDTLLEIIQPPHPEENADDSTGVAVVIKKDTLFYVFSNIGPFKAEERAKGITKRISDILIDKNFSTDSLQLIKEGDDYYIVYGQKAIMLITEGEAVALDLEYSVTARTYYELLKEKLPHHKRKFDLFDTLLDIAYTLLILLILFIIIKLLNWIFRKISKKLENNKDRIFKSIRFRNYEFLTVDRELGIANYLLKVIKIILIIIVFFASLPIVFSFFPATEGITNKLLSYVISPLMDVLWAIYDYLPNLVTILIISFVAHYIIKFTRFLSTEIEKGKLFIPGFYKEWAKPTFNILRFILYVFTFIVIFPYLPGSDSPIFRGVSIFLGILVSLGSSSAISNLIAGLVITYMRPFKIGDRIQIEDQIGDVKERNLLITRIRTAKNKDITIPNSKLLTG